MKKELEILKKGVREQEKKTASILDRKQSNRMHDAYRCYHHKLIDKCSINLLFRYLILKNTDISLQLDDK